jgi:RimJ/RimL family protein N-acetyltransferase
MLPPCVRVIRTARLEMRPFDAAHVDRFVEIQSNWKVGRMLRMANHPPTREAMLAWVEGARREWEEGTAYRFAILFEDVIIGCADLDEISGRHGELGYWLDEAFWGYGLASEAAGALRAFAFETLGLHRLESGHADDNPASGKVLTKLGFIHVGDDRQWSKSRNVWICQQLYRLERT